MSLTDARLGEDVVVKNISTDDEELKSFLFSLGCYSGEKVQSVHTALLCGSWRT